MITPENLVRHELIGLNARVIASTNGKVVGIAGKVVDETRNTLVIENAAGHVATVAKETSVFAFEVGQVWVKIDGRLLVGRPEDRIKKKLDGW